MRISVEKSGQYQQKRRREERRVGRKGSGNRKDRGKNPAGDNAGASVHSSAGKKAEMRGQGAEKGAKDKKKEKRISAQQSIPYREMAKDGICRVLDKYYSKTIRFYDINYQLAQNEDKNAIFENWCDFLNYFDSSIRVPNTTPALHLH